MYGLTKKYLQNRVRRNFKNIAKSQEIAMFITSRGCKKIRLWLYISDSRLILYLIRISKPQCYPKCNQEGDNISVKIIPKDATKFIPE